MSSLMDQLTSRQAAVFEFIKERVQSRGYGPTVREIGEHFQSSSPNGVMCHLRALERKGLLTRVRKHDRAIARAIEHLAESARWVKILGSYARWNEASMKTLVGEASVDVSAV